MLMEYSIGKPRSPFGFQSHPKYSRNKHSFQKKRDHGQISPNKRSLWGPGGLDKRLGSVRHRFLVPRGVPRCPWPLSLLSVAQIYFFMNFCPRRATFRPRFTLFMNFCPRRATLRPRFTFFMNFFPRRATKLRNL